MSTGRLDIYGPVHKAVHMLMGETLTAGQSRVIAEIWRP